MASKEHLALFDSLKESDPKNKRCFECGAPNTTWCDSKHAVYLCLDCSGWHRSLGTHISFVRSVNMDSWQEDKVRVMQKGGNSRAAAFFASKKIPVFGQPGYDKARQKEKWSSVEAFMYIDMLAAEASGQTFDSSSWSPPAYAVAYGTAAAPARPAPSAAAATSSGASGGGRYSSLSSGPPPARAAATSETDVSEVLAKGWSSLTSMAKSASESATVMAKQTSESVSSAATAAVESSKELASNAHLSERASSGWSWLSSSAASAASSAATQWAAVKRAAEDALDDRPVDLTAGLRSSDGCV